MWNCDESLGLSLLPLKPCLLPSLFSILQCVKRGFEIGEQKKVKIICAVRIQSTNGIYIAHRITKRKWKQEHERTKWRRNKWKRLNRRAKEKLFGIYEIQWTKFNLSNTDFDECSENRNFEFDPKIKRLFRNWLIASNVQSGFRLTFPMEK